MNAVTVEVVVVVSQYSRNRPSRWETAASPWLGSSSGSEYSDCSISESTIILFLRLLQAEAPALVVTRQVDRVDRVEVKEEVETKNRRGFLSAL